MDLTEETADVLGNLIRFNTVNPPGNERACQEYLRDYLTEAGFECEMDGVEDERPNLVARLRGESDGPVLGYLSHVDTVLASPEDWSRDPWSGEQHEGHVWGRGALDMKSQTAAEVVAGARAGARGLAPAARRAEDHERGRRGGRRPPRRPVPHAAAPRPRPLRLPPQRGRRAGHPLRRPPPVRRLLRREGHLPLRGAHEGPRRPRLHPGDGRQRAAQAAAAGRAPGHGARRLRPDRRAARLHERARLRSRRSAGGAARHRRGRRAAREAGRADAWA